MPEDLEPGLADDAAGASDGLKKLRKNSTWVAAAQMLVVALRAVESVVVARYLGPASFGLYVLVLAFPDAVRNLADSRTREAVPKFLGEALERDDRQQAVAVMKLLWLVDGSMSFVAFAIVAIAAPFAAREFMHAPEVAPLVILYGAGNFVGALRGPAGSLLRTMDRFALGFWTAISTSLVRFGSLVVALLGGLGLKGLVVALAISEGLGTAILVGAALAVFVPSHWDARHARIKLLGTRLRSMLSFLVFTNLSLTVVMLGGKVDVLIIGAMTSATTAGTYKLAVQMGTMVLLISDPIQAALYPQVARALSQGRVAEIRHMLARLMQVLGVAVVAVCGAALVAAEPLVRWLLGPDYAAAARPATVLLWMLGPSVVCFWARCVMLSAGESKRLFRYFLVGALVQLGLLVVLIRPAGVLGAVVSLGMNYLTVVLLQLGHVWRSRVLRGAVSPIPEVQ